MQRPYFIEYRLDDFATYEAVANYGALTREEKGHQRVVRVTVRIGDYKTDSSSSRGDGTVELAPTDNNPEALRYASGPRPTRPTRTPCAPTPPSRPR
jgi:TldD protein